MLILDTNHVVELGYQSAPGLRLLGRLDEDARPNATTIVSAEEQLRGWMAELHRVRDPRHQTGLYRRLRERIEFYSSWHVLDWDTEAADLFVTHRQQGIRIGTQDLKIACIALTHGATLLTRNVADFRAVPGLLVENWLD
jgi:tRNA(fMet)-specific endonuclease VapC